MKRRSLPLLPPAMAALAAATLAMLAHASEPVATPDADSVLFRDVRVFDGERVLREDDVLVVDGRIAAIGRDLRTPAGVTEVDGRGKTLLPGLIDAHTHSWGEARRDALRFGVTTELDMLGDRARLPQLKRERDAAARTDEADVLSAGAAVTAPGGHGTQYGMAVPALAADGDATAFVRDRIAEGSDYIKIIVEDFSAHSDTRRLPTLSQDQVRTAIRAAQEGDRLALVHVSRLRDGTFAMEAGADGLVHIFGEPADDAFVRAAKRGKGFVIPTLSVLASMAQDDSGKALAADARLTPWLTLEQASTLGATFPGAPKPKVLADAIANVRALHEAGVDVLAGTDAGNPGTAHGAGMHGELALLVRAGLTPGEALRAATALPAKRFALADRGRIAKGLRADLLLVDGDPTADITATRAIAGVWKNGYAIARPRQAQASEAPVGASIGDARLIADFDAAAAPVNGMVPTRFGAGFSPTTDAMAGGASVVTVTRVDGGANGSAGALSVKGEVRTGFAYPWAGAMFFPAAQMMQPVDLSGRSTLVFRLRGDARALQVMLFSGVQVQGMPSVRIVQATGEWTEVRIPLAAFQGADLARVRGIAFTATFPVGAFQFQLDDVSVQ